MKNWRDRFVAAYRSPQGRTAAVTEALALVGGLLAAVYTVAVTYACIGTLVTVSDRSALEDIGLVFGGVIGTAAGLLALLFLGGAYLLSVRRTSGQVLILIASTLNFPFGLILVAAHVLLLPVVVALSLTTIVFAAMPATGRWLHPGRRAVRHYPDPPYPPLETTQPS